MVGPGGCLVKTRVRGVALETCGLVCVRTCQGLHKEISIMLLNGDVIAKAGYNRLIISFYLSVSL